MITYQTFLQTNPNPIINQSDETVQQAVEDWFRYRYIGFEDTAKFLAVLQRNVAVNYPIYKQKLRIQPGVSEYDWLVTTYRERQFGTKGSNTSKTTRGDDTTTTTGDGTKTRTMDYGRTNDLTKTGTVGVSSESSNSNVRTGGQSVAHSVDGSNIRTGGQTDTKSDNSSTIRSGSEVTDGSNNDTATRTGGQTTVKSGNETNAKTGGYTESDVAGEHTTTTSPHVQTQTVTDTGRSEYAGDRQLQGDLPLSQSYTTFTGDASAAVGSDESIQANATKTGMPSSLSWSTATSQGQSDHKGYTNGKETQTTSYVYGTGVEGDVVTTKGSSTDPDTKTVTYDDETDTHTYNDVTDKVTYDDVKDVKSGTNKSTHTYNDVTDKATGSSSDKLVYDALTDTRKESGTDTTTYDNITDTGNGTGSQTTTYDTADKTIEGGQDKETVTDGTTGKTTNAYGNIDVTIDDSRVDQEIVTGRDSDPATLLARATAFIEGSSAWLWLKEQLDSCFYPGYYTDDDEGSCFI